MKCQGAVVLLVVAAVAASMFAVAEANKEWSTAAGNWNHTGTNYWGYRRPNATRTPSNKFVVGGSQNWRFGFNYTDWAIKTAPFFLNDTLGHHSFHQPHTSFHYFTSHEKRRNQTGWYKVV